MNNDIVIINKSTFSTHGQTHNWSKIEMKSQNYYLHNMLLKKSKEIINETTNIVDEYDAFYWNSFTLYLKTLKYDKYFSHTCELPQNNNKKKNKGHVNIRQQIIEQNTEKMRINDFNQMLFDSVGHLTYNGTFNYNESYKAYIILWGITMYKIKSSKDRIYIDCIFSLSRLLQYESKNELKINIQYILDKLKHKIKVIIPNIYSVIFTNHDLILKSQWDKIKPDSIDLYDEQKQVLKIVYEHVTLNKGLLLGFKIPPGSGKTLLSAIIAENINKPVLYACYNKDVRTSIANISYEMGIGFTMIKAIDDINEGLKIKISPHQGCYGDYDRDIEIQKTLSLSNQLKYCENKLDYLPDDIVRKYQRDFVRKFTVKHPGKPLPATMPLPPKGLARPTKIYISDIESCIVLLRDYPDNYVLIIDEVTAGLENGINNNKIAEAMCKMLLVAPKQTILLSATLPLFNEIPIIINDFMMRHNLQEENIIFVYSNQSHISTILIDPSGEVFMPHYYISDVNELKRYITYIKNDALLLRSYHPELVYKIGAYINNDVPLQYKFENYFKNYGDINHIDIRKYIIEIFEYIILSGDEYLFNKIKSLKIKEINEELLIENMLSSQSYLYEGKSLYVTLTTDLPHKINIMTQSIVINTPSVSSIIKDYNNRLQVYENSLEHLITNGSEQRSKMDTMIDIAILNNKPITFKWPEKYIINSQSHASIYNKRLSMYSIPIQLDLKTIEGFDESISKLLLSGVIIYDQTRMTNYQMDLINNYIDNCSFILTIPSIIYGVNIFGLTNIIIDNEYGNIASKNSLEQLIGRGARRNVSEKSIVYVYSWKALHKLMQIQEINEESIILEEIYKMVSI